MKNIILAMLSVFVIFFCSSVSTDSFAEIDSREDVLDAQGIDIASLKEQLVAMEETIKKQQEMINVLKDKIETKEEVAEISKPMNREEREIERVIDNYLAKSDTREKMIEAGLTPKLDLGYKGGFYARTLDDKFYTKIRNRLQFRYKYTDRDVGATDSIPDEDESTFDYRRVRTYISGHAYNKNIKYQLQFDSTADDVDLKDAYIDITYIPWANIWAGQGKVFDREFLTSSSTLQLIDRSSVSEEFRFQGDERKRGVAIHSNKILDGKIDYLVGAYNPQPRATDNNINTLLYMARASYYPFGPFESYKQSDLEYTEAFKAYISGGFAFEQIGTNERPASGKDEVDHTQFIGEFGFKYKGLSLISEYHNRKRSVLDTLEDDALDRVLLGFSSTSSIGEVPAATALHDQGFFVQAGYFLIPKRLEIAGRYEIIDFDDQHPADGLMGRVDSKKFYTAGLTYFFHDREHKIQINYIHKDEDLSGTFFGENDENVFLTQYQLYF
jgi:phosphate-selective porin OprO and OprP